jgi:FdhE protein
MIVETVDPGVDGVRKAVDEYVEKYPEFAQPLRMYGAVMEAQQGALPDLTCNITLSTEEKERRISDGKPLLDPREVDIDPEAFTGLLRKICRAVDEGTPGGFSRCEDLVSSESLRPENIAGTRDRVLSGGDIPEADGWGNEGDKNIVSNIIWETLAPFYRKCGSILFVKMEQSSWQRGFCPVCGSAPLMGQFRDEDGLWIVECSLCHTLWSIQRASCPFCPESYGSLEYLFIEGDTGRRVQYCSSCKFYIKTVNLRDSGRTSLLPLEDIITYDLDLAAGKEGLIPAAGRQ